MVKYQRSDRDLWEMLKENANFKVTKIVETKEGLKVEATAMMTEDIDNVLKALEYCAGDNYSCEGEACPYFSHGRCIPDLMSDAIRYIKQLNADNTHYVDMCGALAYEADGLKKENKELKEKLRIADNQTARFNNAMEESAKANEERKEKLRRAVDENNRLKYEIDAMATQHRAYKGVIDEYEKENSELKEKLRVSEMKLAVSDDTAEERKKMIRYTVAENDRLKQEFDLSIHQNQEFRAKLEAFAKENEALKKKLKNAPAKNCVNCVRYDVCSAVAGRKARGVDDYHPCSFWEKAEEK